MKKLVKQSTKPNLNVDEGEVGLYGYVDEVYKDKNLYREKYTISWLEVENE